jgi:hypothetical protein
MALTTTALKLVAGAGTGNVFHYETADAPGTVAGSGYFNDVTENLKQWDIILVAGTTGGTATVDMLVVTSATAAATVTTTNGT